MNSIEQIELYKNRSYAACIKEAFSVCTHNLKTIFLHTWSYALCLALVTAACVVSVTKVLTNGGSTAPVVGFTASVVLMIAASVALLGRAATLVNGQKTGWNVKRTAKIMLITMAFSLLVDAVLGGVSAAIIASQAADKVGTTTMIVSACTDVFILIVYLLLLPYVYVFTKYMVEPKTKLRRLITKAYRTGLRHWGFIFTTLFLAWLCTTVCTVIVALPAVIIVAALTVSISGVNTLGDPTGLPTYFSAMQFGCFALATFVWTYISIFSMFVCYYVYGSIETREKERSMITHNL